MTIRPKSLRKGVRCLITLLAVSLCPLLPVNGFVQEQSDQISKLIEQLKSLFYSDSENAADALAKIGKDAVPALTEILKKDTSLVARANAATALGRIGANARIAVPDLIHVLNNDRDFGVRANAARALGEIGAETEVVAPALIHALTSPDSVVRNHAARALGQIGAVTNDVVPALVQTFKYDTDRIYSARLQAALSLGRIGADAKTAVPDLIYALKNDPDLLTRIGAVNALGSIASKAQDVAKDIVLILIETVKNDSNPGVHVGAAIALAEISRGSYYARTTEMLPELNKGIRISKRPS